jgi:hypothetical protein
MGGGQAEAVGWPLSLSSLRRWQPSGGPAEAAAAAQVHAEAATHCLVFFYSCLVHEAAVAHCF